MNRINRYRNKKNESINKVNQSIIYKLIIRLKNI